MRISDVFGFLVCVVLSFSSKIQAQQDAQYTQYMYSTQVINPAYGASQEFPTVSLLARSQWAGIEGAPKTGILATNVPLGEQQKTALGISVVHDVIGPATQTNLSIDYAYNLKINNQYKLALGLKAGAELLNIDFNKLKVDDAGDFFESAIDQNLQPQVGAGIYFYDNRFYTGFSVPNVLQNSHFDDQDNAIEKNRQHYYLMLGYVFPINENIKFKPATLFKVVNGAPLQWDFSANFLFYDRLTFGAAYRWSSAVSLLAGFQVIDQIFIGAAYDHETTALKNYSNGSYEVVARFTIFNKRNCACSLKPRFF